MKGFIKVPIEYRTGRFKTTVIDTYVSVSQIVRFFDRGNGETQVEILGLLKSSIIHEPFDLFLTKFQAAFEGVFAHD